MKACPLPALLLLATATLAAGQVPAATQAAAPAVTLKPGDEVKRDDLLEGGAAQDAAVEGGLAASRRHQQTGGVMREFQEALRAGDAAKMAASIEALEALDPQAPFLAPMRLDHALTTKDWERAASLITEVGKSAGAAQTLGMLAFRAEREGEQLPAPLRTAIAAGFAKAIENEPNSPTPRVVLASLYWQLGDKQSALAAAKTAAEHPGELPAEPFRNYLKALESGTPPPAVEVFSQVRAALHKQAADQTRPQAEPPPPTAPPANR